MLRVLAGPQAQEFGDAFTLFLASEWTISSGVRPDGISPRRSETGRIAKGHNIVSDGTVNGSIQVPGSGQPIALMRDRGTTGGYPKIATVIGPDLGLLAQRRVGAERQILPRSASRKPQAEARRFAELIKSLDRPPADQSASGPNLEALHDANLAGHAVNAFDAATWQTSSHDDDFEGRVNDDGDSRPQQRSRRRFWHVVDGRRSRRCSTSSPAPMSPADSMPAIPTSCWRSSKLAKAKGVSIGAHPCYRDLHGFGRRPVAGPDRVGDRDHGRLPDRRAAGARDHGRPSRHLRQGARRAVERRLRRSDDGEGACVGDQGGRPRPDLGGAAALGDRARRRSCQPAARARGLCRSRL